MSHTDPSLPFCKTPKNLSALIAGMIGGMIMFFCLSCFSPLTPYERSVLKQKNKNLQEQVLSEETHSQTNTSSSGKSFFKNPDKSPNEAKGNHASLLEPSQKNCGSITVFSSLGRWIGEISSYLNSLKAFFSSPQEFSDLRKVFAILNIDKIIEVEMMPFFQHLSRRTITQEAFISYRAHFLKLLDKVVHGLEEEKKIVFLRPEFLVRSSFPDYTEEVLRRLQLQENSWNETPPQQDASNEGSLSEKQSLSKAPSPEEQSAENPTKAGEKL